ncbi:transcriptional regulator, LacI family [Abditibacterium utsteinense]|uniref:Transcriptional regulator, LacI family n=1 Tax=Abditibacterium utsteinense TaxID=1960156 RepID=A0A2S8SQ51_9BACT|nr:LacI family DNA-binding transcriptional regulator [Abditibacterium utsteinense]PQV62914.1 transcriptional regulator, LacI family [Abditibacterium utsteinense]
MNEVKPSKPDAGRRKSKSVTLHDVAQRAGVHVMTVSNALKGTGRMTATTRATICRIAAELNYKPNRAARALVTGRTGAVAVVTGPVSEHFYAHVVHLLELELAASQTQMIFMCSRYPERDLEFLIQSSMVDGLIAIDAFSELRALSSTQGAILPCVYAGVLHPELAPSLSVDCIAVDLSDAAQDAVQALLDLGCERVAYLVSNEGMAHSEDVRARTYRAAMEQVGRRLEIINVDIGIDTSRRDLTRARLVEHIQTHGAPDGLLCQNDEMAISAYRALRDIGLRVPDDVRLIGCDGLDDMDYFDPPLATIMQPVEKMCALAWEFLQIRLKQPEVPLQRAVLRAQLRQRASLAP